MPMKIFSPQRQVPGLIQRAVPHQMLVQKVMHESDMSEKRNYFHPHDVAAEWHGGMNSPMYSYVSTDKVHGEAHRKALLDEIDHNLQSVAKSPKKWRHPGLERARLEHLRRHISKHPLCGDKNCSSHKSDEAYSGWLCGTKTNGEVEGVDEGRLRRDEEVKGFPFGTPVYITMGAGAGDTHDKPATVVSHREVRRDGRGVPAVQGAYKPMTPATGHVAIKLANGKYDIYHKGHLSTERPKWYPAPKSESLEESISSKHKLLTQYGWKRDKDESGADKVIDSLDSKGKRDTYFWYKHPDHPEHEIFVGKRSGEWEHSSGVGSTRQGLAVGKKPGDSFLKDWLHQFHTGTNEASGRRRWMQGAVHHKGALRATAKAMGLIKGDEPLSHSALDTMEQSAREKGNTKLLRRVNLARTFMSSHEGVEEAQGHVADLEKQLRAAREHPDVFSDDPRKAAAAKKKISGLLTQLAPHHRRQHHDREAALDQRHPTRFGESLEPHETDVELNEIRFDKSKNYHVIDFLHHSLMTGKHALPYDSNYPHHLHRFGVVHRDTFKHGGDNKTYQYAGVRSHNDLAIAQKAADRLNKQHDERTRNESLDESKLRDIDRARRIAYEWHSGMSSPLYSFASTGGHIHSEEHRTGLSSEIKRGIDSLNQRGKSKSQDAKNLVWLHQHVMSAGIRTGSHPNRNPYPKDKARNNPRWPSNDSLSRSLGLAPGVRESVSPLDALKERLARVEQPMNESGDEDTFDNGAYIYQAALHCESCGRRLKAKLAGQGRMASDSDHYPQGPYPNGGGEADSPQHCDSCGKFLKNPLTKDGENYVRVAHAERPTKITRMWMDHYSYLKDKNESRSGETLYADYHGGTWHPYFHAEGQRYTLKPEGARKMIKQGAKVVVLEPHKPDQFHKWLKEQ